MKKSAAINKIRSLRYDGGFLSECPEQLRDDEEVVIAAIKRGYNLDLESNKIREAKIRAASFDVNQFRFKFRRTTSLFGHSRSPLQFASDRLRSDAEIALLALDHHNNAVHHISEELLSNPEFVRKAGTKNQIVFRHLSSALQEDSEFMASILRGDDGKMRLEVYENCPDSIRNDEVLVGEVIQTSEDLSLIPETFRDSEQMVRRFLDVWLQQLAEGSVRSYYVVNSFKAVSLRLRNQKDIKDGFIHLDPRCFDVLTEEQKRLDENQNVLVDSIQKRIADKVSCYPYLPYFQFLDKSDRTNPMVINLFLGKGMEHWLRNFEQKIKPHVPAELVLNSSGLWLELTKKNPQCLKYAPATMKRNPIVVLNAIRKDEKAVAHCSAFLRLMNSIGLLGFYAALFGKR